MMRTYVRGGSLTILRFTGVERWRDVTGLVDKWFPIRTSRLMLREFLASDEQDLHEYASDRIVTQYVEWGPNTRDQSRERMSGHLREQQLWPRDDVMLAIELSSEGKVIGTIQLTTSDKRNRTANLGYVVNRRYWNQGYATEAAIALLDRAFTAQRLHRVWATCDTRNAGSWRVMEKAAMRREGFFRRDILQRGEWRDSYLYARLEDD
jgi:ribosomal-protein-alanine N-acetyltransferase